MGSTRLPGKVMKLLGGTTVLAHVIHRVKACPLVDEVLVATTELSRDDVIANAAPECGAAVFRGSEEDVLSRYYGAALSSKAEVVVRVTSDCPLFDPGVLTHLLTRFFEANSGPEHLDYLTNTLVETFPRGLDAEVFTFQALEQAARDAKKAYEREHVTPYLHQHPELFRLENFRSRENLSHHRWTLDTEEDFALISAIYTALYRPGQIFTTDAVLAFLDSNPGLLKLNAHVQQKTLEQ
jgi:spore coat polysaccharide biosynthesis protein SpsF